MESSDDDGYAGPDALMDDESVNTLAEEADSENEFQNFLDALIQLNASQSASNPVPSRGINASVFGRLLGLSRMRYEDEGIQRPSDSDSPPALSEKQSAGEALLMSGDFGRLGPKLRSRRSVSHAVMYLKSKSQLRIPSYREEMASNLLPNSSGSVVASYSANIYCGQFSTDASLYYTCSQDFRLYLYDMTAPRLKLPRRQSNSYCSHQTTMEVVNEINGEPGRWTITDSHLSPDNERMIYSSLSPTVYMTNTRNPDPMQVPISFADRPGHSYGLAPLSENFFGIWSCRFSADGNEVIAGGNGKIFVYDLIANRRTVKISAHNDDVNSCCWADTGSGNILISASDDTFIKVWDRRSLGISIKPSGVLVGHTEGITFVSSKGDGRYVISNGKDQAMRLWDLRKMCSSDEAESISPSNYQISGFDYRHHSFPKKRMVRHPKDCSVTTYRGHTVLRTLIRCHFSPAETTGSQYLYSGSADGRIHIWSLDGRVVQVLNRSNTRPIHCDPSGPEQEHPPHSRGRCLVRDISWSPQEPAIMSAAWDAYERSTVARHEWKGLSKSSNPLQDWVEKQTLEGAERAVGSRATRHRRPMTRSRRRQYEADGMSESMSEDEDD